MPIPPFDCIHNVLPPHLGVAGNVTNLSPYVCTVDELCRRFATSPARKLILTGLLDLRREFFTFGIRGFQWLDGSFVEDIETQELRDPKDIDVVTFVSTPAAPVDLSSALATKPNLLNRAHVKSTYRVDHFWLPLGSNPTDLVEQTRYWYGLFSHRRDRTWKGMLAVNLTNQADDDAARPLLGGNP